MAEHFILDFETLGTSVFTAPVVSVAFYTFEWTRFTSDNPYTFKELVNNIKFEKIDAVDQMKNYGYKPEKSTVEWWKAQGEEAKKLILPSDKDVNYDKLTDIFIEYWKPSNIKYWWSRSNTFDPLFLERIFRDTKKLDEMKSSLKYWSVRDIRTYIDTKTGFKNFKNDFCPIDDEEKWNKYFVKHNPIHDVAADILRIQRIERILNSGVK